ncbi:unnamed protein product [Periconia digitata]|uniref:Uncharacterized protein n=1 Tax=Periconia digitata TaxID=1303443 RepID=A0A9W4USA7_9PLEO|nr:unnamed protein product [Periconia digitata]
MHNTSATGMKSALLSGATVSLSGAVLAGAFSLFTEGAHTPSLYAYQIDRIPETLAIIPLVDAAIGTLLLFRKTRIWAALICTLDQGGGIVKRLAEGKSIESDLGIFALAAGIAVLAWFVEHCAEQVNFKVNVTRVGYSNTV